MSIWESIAVISLASAAMLGWVARRYYPVKFTTQRLAIMGLLVAMGTAAAPLVVPVGPAKAYPVQHTINVLAAVILGPVEATMVALVVGVLRNLLGIGTVLALPGGLIGAFLAGMAYRALGSREWAVAGEIVGTGLLGALASVPIVRLVLGQQMLAFALVIPFTLSSAVGAAVAYILMRALQRWITPEL